MLGEESIDRRCRQSARLIGLRQLTGRNERVELGAAFPEQLSDLAHVHMSDSRISCALGLAQMQDFGVGGRRRAELSPCVHQDAASVPEHFEDYTVW